MSDSKLIIQAASAAQKAADYVRREPAKDSPAVKAMTYAKLTSSSLENSSAKPSILGMVKCPQSTARDAAPSNV
jgi:hypothetical protein